MNLQRKIELLSIDSQLQRRQMTKAVSPRRTLDANLSQTSQTGFAASTTVTLTPATRLKRPEPATLAFWTTSLKAITQLRERQVSLLIWKLQSVEVAYTTAPLIRHNKAIAKRYAKRYTLNCPATMQRCQTSSNWPDSWRTELQANRKSERFPRSTLPRTESVAREPSKS